MSDHSFSEEIILLCAVVSYSCACNQSDVLALCHVWSSLSLASDSSFSRHTRSLMAYSNDIVSFCDSELCFLFVYMVHLPLELR